MTKSADPGGANGEAGVKKGKIAFASVDSLVETKCALKVSPEPPKRPPPAAPGLFLGGGRGGGKEAKSGPVSLPLLPRHKHNKRSPRNCGVWTQSAEDTLLPLPLSHGDTPCCKRLCPQTKGTPLQWGAGRKGRGGKKKKG